MLSRFGRVVVPRFYSPHAGEKNANFGRVPRCRPALATLSPRCRPAVKIKVGLCLAAATQLSVLQRLVMYHNVAKIKQCFSDSVDELRYTSV